MLCLGPGDECGGPGEEVEGAKGGCTWENERESDEKRADGPRMYWSGSPVILRSSMSRSAAGRDSECFIHANSCRAHSRPMASASFASRFCMVAK